MGHGRQSIEGEIVMLQFGIRTLAILTVLIAVGCCWHSGHQQRQRTIDDLDVEVTTLQEAAQAKVICFYFPVIR